MQYLNGRLDGAIRQYGGWEDKLGMLKYIPRFAIISAVTVVAIAAIGMTWQTTAEYKDSKTFLAPGTRVDIGGYKLHMLKTGNKGPVVVLEAGLGCNHMDWTVVQRELSKDATVISYDRAGYGWSDRSPFPRTSSIEVDELKALLDKSGTVGPYIMVGHSYGGLNARLFALRYPNEVSGLVLVESCHEEQNLRQPEEPPAGLNRWHGYGNPDWARLLTRIGFTRFFLPFSELPDDLTRSFSEKVKNAYLATIETQKFAEVNYEETRLFDESGEQVKRANHSFGPLPLVVLTGGEKPAKDAEAEDRVWHMMQKEMKHQSSIGVHLYTGTKYDHMIPWHEPEKVVEAVRLIFKAGA